MTLPQETGPPLGPQTLRLQHDGRVRDLTPIVFLNGLLNLVTLTLYRFWAKTHVRRFLWSGTSLLGDRFEYTGTGKELFLGFLIVLFVFILPAVGLNFAAEYFWAEEDPIRYAAFVFIFYLVALFLIGVAIYRARRFRLSRTAWRGIRPALIGSSAIYGLMNMAIYLANGVTLGWAYPWGRLRLMEQMMVHTYFGDRPFHFRGNARPLYGRFAAMWFGSIALLILMIVVGVAAAGGASQAQTNEGGAAAAGGIGVLVVIVAGIVGMAALYAWYKAKELAYFADCTRFEGLRFRFHATTWSLLRLVLGNYLIVILTLSFGFPFAQLRNFRYFCRRLEAVGEVDFEAIRQSAEARPSVGEGLADAFDLGTV